MNPLALFAVIAASLTLSACLGKPQSRMGMVVNQETGLMYGSAIEKNLLTDAVFYNNRKIKVRTRNTSGDLAFGLGAFTDDLNGSYEAKGYEPTQADDFGLLLDVNVMYSGQIQTNRAYSFTMVGALLGTTYGGGTRRGQIAGTVAGAELGRIIGSYATEDTYMVLMDVSFGVIKPYKESRKRVTFSHSKKLKDIDDPDEDDKVIRRGFKQTFTTQVAVYAGGRNISQSEIAEQVRKRAARIIADFI